MKRKAFAVLLSCVILAACAAEIPPAEDGAPVVTQDTDLPVTATTAPPVTTMPPVPATLPPPAPEPYTGSRLVVLLDDGYSLIPERETALISELKDVFSRFNFPLLPESISDGVLNTSALSLTRIYQDYAGAGLIEPYQRTAEELENYGFITRDGLFFESVMKVDNISYILDDLLSERLEHALTEGCNYFTSDGLFGYGAFGVTSGFHLLLKDWEQDGDYITLDFYSVYNSGHDFWRKGYVRQDDDSFTAADSTVVGEWEIYIDENRYHIGTGNIVLYEDLLDTLDVVRYTFVPEDGKYKLLNIDYVNN